MEFPEILQPFAKDLRATKRESLSIDVFKENTGTLQSKFGGHPYWLKDEPYPYGADGEPLRLLAQINFSEIDSPLENFPTTGILQFFISSVNNYGMSFDDMTKQNNFRVVYHKMIEQDASKWLMAIPKSAGDYFPVEAEFSLSFEKEEELVSQPDFRFFEITGILDENMDLYDDISEVYYDEFYNGEGHKLGGYPFFTQDDPRLDGEYPNHLIQLLQMDSDDHDDELLIMWGDSGTGHFFITEEDLKNSDFTKVLYYWDCY